MACALPDFPDVLPLLPVSGRRVRVSHVVLLPAGRSLRIDLRERMDVRGARVSESSPGARDLVELLDRCGAGDKAAFRRLYEAQSARLYGVALRITRQSALAADAVHDAMLQVWQNAGRFDPSRGNPESWMVSLVHYRALDIVRRRAREMPGLELPDMPDEEPGVLDRMLGASDASALHACLQELEEGRRRMILLAFVDGLTHTELAEKLAIPLGTVKSWIRRGMATLRLCLER